MSKLPLHISSGGVVYKKEDDKIFIALLGWFRKWGQLWMFPKETVENSDANGRDFEDEETLKNAAWRALKEEMNIEGEIENYLGSLQEFTTIDKTKKERHIHYFLFRYKSGDMKHSWEHNAVKWVTIEEIANLRLKKGEDEIVQKALLKIAT